MSDKIVENCLIINLDYRVDLWNSIKKFRDSWIEIGKSITRIQGLDLKNEGHIFNKLILSSRIDLNGRGFRKGRTALLGEIGCYMAHYNCWKYIVDNELESCLILEDGIEILRNDYENIKIQGDTDILFLNDEMKKYEHLFYGYGLQGYVVTHMGAIKLLKTCYKLSSPIDLQIRNLCTTNELNGNVENYPFFKRNSNRLSSIEENICDMENLNDKQDVNHNLFERIIINMIKNNVDIDKFL